MKMRLRWPKSYENHKAQFPKLSGLFAKNRLYVIITLKMVKIEFNFEFIRLGRLIYGQEITYLWYQLRTYTIGRKASYRNCELWKDFLSPIIILLVAGIRY